MIDVKLYKSPFKGLKLIAITIPFVVAGIWMVLKESPGSNNYIMGWLCISFFGLGIPLGLFHTFDRRPQIIINENGIWDRSTYQDEIKWEQINGAYLLEINNQKFVSLIVDDTFELKKKQFKWAAKVNEAFGAQKINLNLSQLKKDEHQMTAFIKEIIAVNKSNRKDIIKKYFDS